MSRLLAFLLVFFVAEYTLHAKQMRAVYSPSRITIMCAGIQGGKTTAGGIWMKRQVFNNSEKQANFLITAPTVKIFNQSTEPKFLELFHGYGKYNKVDQVFEMNHKRRIYLRSLHEPDSIEGMTNVYAIWPDELGKCNLKAWTNIEGRSAFKQAPIFGTTTPYALNWLWKDVYKPWKAGKRDDVDFIQFASIDNPHFPKAEYERQKRLLDPRVFAMKYMGQFERMAGLVYPDLDDTLNFEPPFAPHPRDYMLVAGVDFGFTNPFAVSVRALHRREPRDYQVAEFYRTGMLLEQKGDKPGMTEILRMMQDKLGVEAFYADSAEPRTIAELQARGIKIHPVKKGPDSLKHGIDAHRELINSREHKIFAGKCPHTEDEYATYHYPEVDGDEENQSENPVDANNHLMNAGMYVTVMTKEFRRIRDNARIYQPPASDLEELLSGEWAKKTFGKSNEGDWFEDA